MYKEVRLIRRCDWYTNIFTKKAALGGALYRIKITPSLFFFCNAQQFSQKINQYRTLPNLIDLVIIQSAICGFFCITWFAQSSNFFHHQWLFMWAIYFLYTVARPPTWGWQSLKDCPSMYEEHYFNGVGSTELFGVSGVATNVLNECVYYRVGRI